MVAQFLPGRNGFRRICGWWTKYAGLIGTDYADLIGLEAEARTIRTYEQELVPGLLQIPEYAQAVIRSSRPTETSDQAWWTSGTGGRMTGARNRLTGGSCSAVSPASRPPSAAEFCHHGQSKWL